ncbi:DUF969 domain-containing protein [Paraburkholderia caballeronis]|uniref:Uncharacterized membrane protein n=1 Tax=Paraburkholderia caballeronis TaxID=416943 RepID=A0A1H7EYV7_9BURK|nr:DUF969 domain-containing protein [Paraburkholderia caballeronis]PXW23875.1 putative membrane protein [Paraburkholderia caballeronis]PXW99639.1 putative membrane protein [Paraburkholderia caballeronis]RAJ96593.1 putative membrane protein [Paraburkholderia caballeronis]TDV15581.1 putative membrane protein [Paraburkholderia caballeronis]TDV17836.1 putative membrane protein [Paraburkholderia caballeronis]
MQSAVNLYPLIGVAVIVVGFVLRFNPMLIVTLAAIATGFAAHFPLDRIFVAIGSGFVKTRVIPLIILLPLAVIGLLERHGLRERAQIWIGGIRAATPGRLLVAYLFVREITAALGLTGLGGHPQMVRPLVAPMAEGAAEARYGKLTDAVRYRLRAFAASADNVGLFFGEDVFVAFGAIVLMVTFLKEAGIAVEPMRVALWGMPTALAAFIVHGFRLYRLDGWLARHASSSSSSSTPASAPSDRDAGADTVHAHGENA